MTAPSTKKHSIKVTILNEEYTLRSDTPPEHARAVALHLDRAIRAVMNAGVVETNRAVVLAALQITAEMLDAKTTLEATVKSIDRLNEYVRPLLPPAKRTPPAAAQPVTS